MAKSKIPGAVWVEAERAYKAGGSAAAQSIIRANGYEIARDGINLHMRKKEIELDEPAEMIRWGENPPPTTRRCRNKDCITRFVPVNGQNFYCSPECRVATDTWSVDEVLQEEGSLFPEATHMEMAKAAFAQKNMAVRRVTQLSSLRDYLSYEVHQFYEENPEYRFPSIPAPEPFEGARGERAVLIQLGDWQIGKLENGIGVDVMREQRLPRIKAAARAIVQRQRDAGYTVNTAVVSFGGDTVEGCQIYGGQNVTGLDRTANTHRITKQIRTAAHMQADVLTDVASYVNDVLAVSVPGNHGRSNGKNDYADPEDNFDLLVSEWCSDMLAEPRIRWQIADDWWAAFDVLGHRVVSFHGDQWRAPTWKLEDLLPKWLANGVFGGRPEIVLTHHRHDFVTFRVAGITVSQSGTIDGGSKWYLKAYGKSSQPSQTVLVISEKRAVESIFPIDFS